MPLSVVLSLDRGSILRLVRRVHVGLAGKPRELDNQHLVERCALDPFQQLVVEPPHLVRLELDILFGEEVVHGFFWRGP